MTQVPAGWRSAALGDLLTEPLINGRSVPTRPGGFPVLRLTALKGGCVDLGERKEGAWSAADAGPYLVREGDFLVARGNGSLSLVGRGGLVGPVNAPVAFPDTLIRVRPDPGQVDLRFLALLWSSEIVRRQLESQARTTAGIYKVNQQHLRQIQLPIPPVDEQRRMVDIVEDHLSRLDVASALLARSGRRSTALDTAIAHRALTRAGGEPVSLGDLARSVRNGIFAPRPDAQANGVPILRIGAVRSLMLDLSDLRYSRESEAALKAAGALLAPGDLLFTRYNGNPLYVGACATVPTLAGPVTYPDKLIRVQPRTEIIDPSFLAIACSVGEARTQIQARVKTTAGQAGISGRDLRSVVVRVPSLEAQQIAVGHVGAAREEARRLRHSLTAIDGRLSRLRRSLLAAAFSGRLTGASSDMDRVEELASV